MELETALIVYAVITVLVGLYVLLLFTWCARSLARIARNTERLSPPVSQPRQAARPNAQPAARPTAQPPFQSGLSANERRAMADRRIKERSWEPSPTPVRAMLDSAETRAQLAPSQTRRKGTQLEVPQGATEEGRAQ